jgi:hypothetical protein
MKPVSLVPDSAYGSAESLAWLVNQKAIKPFIPVIDKSSRADGTFSRDDFAFDPDSDRFTCTQKPARFQGTFTRTPGTRRALSLQRLNMRPPAIFERRLRCCSLTSNESFGSLACA